MADCTVFNDASLVFIAGLGEAGTPGTAFVSKPESGAHLSVTRDGNAWGVNRNGVLEQFSAGMPVTEFSEGVLLGTRAEQASTQRMPNPTDIDAVTYTKSNLVKNGDVTPTVLPGVTGRRYDPVGTSVFSNLNVQSIGTGLNGEITYYFIVQYDGWRWVELGTSQDPLISRVWFDLENGVIGTNQGGRGRMFTLANNTYLISYTTQGRTNGSTSTLFFAFRSADNSLAAVNGNGTGVVFIAAQYEVSLVPTSFISTLNAVRNPDIITRTGISSLIGQTQGRIKLNANIRTFAADATIVEFWEDSNNFIRVSKLANNTINLLIHSGGVERINVSSTAITAGVFDIEVGYQVGTCELIINGGTAITASAAAIPACSKYNLGSKQDNTAYLNGHVKITSMQQNF